MKETSSFIPYSGDKRKMKISAAIVLLVSLAAFIALICVGVGAVDDSDAATFEVDGVKYTGYDMTLTAVVTGNSLTSPTDVTIPSTVENGGKIYNVVQINDRTFQNSTNVKSVVIGNNVKSIGMYAFNGCSILTSATIGSSVETIGNGAFMGCSSLTSIAIPDSVKTIGTAVFRDCTSLVTVTIGKNVATFGGSGTNNSAFSGCTALTSITVDPANTKFSSDERGVLFEGDMLKKYPAGNTAVSYAIPNNVKTTDYFAFDYCSSLVSVTIGSSVETIGAQTFGNCISLTSIDIPDSVKYIGNTAFYKCTSLATVTLGKNVATICESGKNTAFQGCTALTSITVDPANTKFSSDERGALFDKEKTVLRQYPLGNAAASYVIPDTVKTIDMYAFNGCKSLVSMTIGSSVETISDQAFKECTALVSMTIGSQTINNNAFQSCTALESVTLLDTVKSIGRQAFYLCTSLKSIVIPDSVETLSADGQQFWLCSSLSSATLGKGMTKVPNSMFRGCALVSITIPAKITEIGDSAFACTTLKEIIVENGNLNYKSVGNVLFTADEKTLLQYPAAMEQKEYAVPEGVNTIGGSAFNGCSVLEKVTIPSSVTSINYNDGKEAFLRCMAMKEFSVAEENTVYKSIGGVLFSKDGKTLIQYPLAKVLEEYTIPSGTEIIGIRSFAYCNVLKTVVIPSTVTRIEANAFGSSSSLESITIPSTVKTIGGYTFMSSTALTSVTIKAEIVSTSSQMFQGCTSLRSVVLPDTLTTIVNKSFDGCSSLTHISIPSKVATINNNAFSGCNLLVEICNDSALELEKGSSAYGGIALNAENIYSSKSGASILKTQALGTGIDAVYYELEGKVTLVTVYGHGTSLVLPKTVGTKSYQIHDYAFSGRSLERVYISSGVTSIGSHAFDGCASLVHVDVAGETPAALGTDAFSNCSEDLKVFVPLEANATYKDTDGWKALNLYSYISEPEPAEELTYDRTEQTGVAAAAYDEYTLGGTFKATAAGDYSATATPNKGFVWNDDTSDARSINWSIAKKDVFVVGLLVEDKTYDGTVVTKVTCGALEGLISGDEVTVSATGEFSDKNVGEDKDVTVKYTLSGKDAGNYTIEDDMSSAMISQRLVSIIGLTAVDKTYDGTTDAVAGFTSLGNIVQGDDVSGEVKSAAFADKNVAFDETGILTKFVAVEITISGTDADNYMLDYYQLPAAKILPKKVDVIGLSAPGKTYDGTTSATASFTSLDGILTGDVFTAEIKSAAFADKNAGQDKIVNVSFTVGGTDVGNYYLYATMPNATIDQKQVTVSGIIAKNKAYDGTTAAVLDCSKVVVAGLITGETVAASAVGVFADANIGTNKTVIISDLVLAGKDAGNYVLASTGQQTETKANITGYIVKFTYEDKTKAADDVQLGTSAAISEPKITIKADQIIAGWYNGTALWNFKDKVTSDMTLVVKITQVQTGGEVIVKASENTAVDVELKSGTTKVTVVLSKGTVSIDNLNSTDRLNISIEKEAAGDDRFDVTVKLGDVAYTDKPIVIVLPYAKEKGVPNVYYYPATGDKVKMDASINEDAGIVTFTTTHNSVYGIEYVQQTGVATLALWIVVAVLGVILFGVLIVRSRP